jgi:homoserine dehydrogenase
MRILLIGFGVVGQGLARLLRDPDRNLQSQEGFQGQLVGVVTRSHGSLYHPAGLDLDALLAAVEQGSLAHYPDSPALQRDPDTLQLIRDSDADVLVEASVTKLEHGQPALDYCRAAFASGKHVVLANKGPVAVAYDELRQLAGQTRKQLLFEATVMAGTPSLRLGAVGLAGCKILSARGILNGTTNYILTQMENGMDYAAALAQAQQLGYAEADPTADVDGWDAAGKAIILAAALFGQRLSFADMSVSGISHLSAADIETARAAGERWKLIATVSPAGGRVEALRLPLSDPLANVAGANNAISYSTDLLGNVTLVGPGAGQMATAAGLLADLLAIWRL